MDQGTENQERNKSFDEFVSTLRTSQNSQDALLILLFENWQRILGIAFVLLLVVWLTLQFRQSAREADENAATLFAALQENYSKSLELEPAVEKTSADPKTDADKTKPPAVSPEEVSLETRIESLKKTHPESVYSKFADLYAAVSLLKSGKSKQARELLAKFPRFTESSSTSSLTTARSLSSDAFLSEFAHLLQARTLLAQNNSAEAWSDLRSLTLHGTLLNVEALRTLKHIANTPERKEEVRTLGKELSEKRPELASQIQSEIPELTDLPG